MGGYFTFQGSDIVVGLHQALEYLTRILFQLVSNSFIMNILLFKLIQFSF